MASTSKLRSLDAESFGVLAAVTRYSDHSLEYLAQMLALPIDRIRVSLDLLEKRGLIQASQHTRGGWQPRSAEGLTEVRQREIDERLDEVRALVGNSIDEAVAVARLSAESESSVGNQVEVVVGVEAITERLAGLVSKADTCVDAMFLSVPSEHMFTTARIEEERTLGSRVPSRVIYPSQARVSSSAQAYAEWASTHGTDVRVCAEIPLQVTIVDRSIILVPGEQVSGVPTALTSSSRWLVRAAIETFEAAWSTGVPLLEGDTRGELSAIERNVLLLMSQGQKDSVIGSTLGVSDRSVRRIVAKLQERIGTTGRFQLGIEAARRGWLRKHDTRVAWPVQDKSAAGRQESVPCAEKVGAISQADC